MRRVLEGDRADVCSREFVCEIHEAFYDRLPPHHQFTHGPQGFTRFTVNPGLFRDVDVSVDNGASTLGPHADELPERFWERAFRNVESRQSVSSIWVSRPYGR